MEEWMQQIREYRDHPAMLEQLYRQHPVEFTASFGAVFAEYPDSLILQAWNERLRYESQMLEGNGQVTDGEKKGEETPTEQGEITERWRGGEVLLVVILALVAGLIGRHVSTMSGMESTRYVSYAVFPWVALYFLVKRWPGWQIAGVVAAVFFGGLGLAQWLPISQAQTVTLSFLHFPLVLWAMVGVAFTGREWRNRERRMAYLWLNGEVLIYSAILLLGGVVLTLLALILFRMSSSAYRFISEYVAIFGACAVPVVATYLTEARKRFLEQLLPSLSVIFSPMLLVLLFIYLLNMVVTGQGPFQDRDILLTLNVVLILVMVMVTFLLAVQNTQRKKNVSDYITFTLCLAAVVVNTVAFIAILMRFAEYGLTPNRLAVLGANILIFIHLLGVIVQLRGFLWKGRSLADVERWIAGYLSVYVIWTLLVVVGFPLIFGVQ